MHARPECKVCSPCMEHLAAITRGCCQILDSGLFMNAACLSPYHVCVCNDQIKLFTEHPHKVKSAERKCVGER